MAHFGEIGGGLDLPFIADGAITKYTIVKLSTESGGNQRVVVAAASTDVPLGVAQETVATGAPVLVRLAGVSLVSANGAFTEGDELMVAASDGEVDTFSSSAGVGAYVVGIALETAAAAQNQKAMLIRMHHKQTND
jgi:hypothetical protein